VSIFVSVAAAFGLFVVALFILHVVASTYLLRAEPPRLTHGDPAEFEWHIVIPALNEEAVLNDTLSRLSIIPFAHLWVVNDASDDRTAEIAEHWRERSTYVHVVTRALPSARTGKGAVLNDAYRAISHFRLNSAFSETPIRTIVGVVDADGVLDPNTFAVLAGPHCFADPKVGAVQQDVWMRNVDDRKPYPGAGKLKNYAGATLLRLQDVEFRASIAAIQHTRHHTHSVAMGGNGQWTRLEALDDIVLLDTARWNSKRAEQSRHAVRPVRAKQLGPWHGGLLEDFELGLHLLMTGWVTQFTPGCYVAQEALPSVSRYLRQRVRWCQGSMQCLRYLPDLWKSAFIGPWALLELCYYLTQPWLWIVGTFLFPVPLIDAAAAFFRSPSEWFSWVHHDGGWMWLFMFWGTALGPLMSWAFTYRSVRAHSEGTLVTRRQSFHDGLAYVVLVNLSYVIAWRAFFRLLWRKNGWSKTARVSEQNVTKRAQLIETSSQL
jgi:1,2-diacylglycerol 3-beta-glucosyltransferase